MLFMIAINSRAFLVMFLVVECLCGVERGYCRAVVGGSSWNDGEVVVNSLPRAATAAFGVFQTPLSSVHIKTYRAAVCQPGNDNAFIHGMYSNRMMMWKLGSDYKCSLVWMRDTADHEVGNYPTITAMRFQDSSIHTVGYRGQFNPDTNNPLCRFSIGIGADTGWSVFSVNQLNDSTEIAKYPVFYYPIFRRVDPYWYLVHSWNNTFVAQVLDDSGRVLKTREYLTASIDTDWVVSENIIPLGQSGYGIVGGLGDKTFLTIGSPPRAANQMYFARLDATWDTLWQRFISSNDPNIVQDSKGLSTSLEYKLISPISYLNRVEHLAWPGLMVLDSSGGILINRQYKELMDVNLYGSMATKDGDVIIYGSKGPLDPVGNSPLTSRGYAFAARLSAKTGDIIWLNVYDDLANIASVFTTGCITESGRIILAGQLQGKFLYCGIRDSVLITSVDDANSDDGVHAPELTVQPTPTRDVLTASLRGVQADVCSFGIYDISGRELFRSSAPATGGTCTITMSTASLSTGSYVLRCTAGRSSASQTIIIER